MPRPFQPMSPYTHTHTHTQMQTHTQTHTLPHTCINHTIYSYHVQYTVPSLPIHATCICTILHIAMLSQPSRLNKFNLPHPPLTDDTYILPTLALSSSDLSIYIGDSATICDACTDLGSGCVYA